MSFLGERLKRLGPVVKYYQLMYPSDSTCYHCGLPWSVVKIHSITVHDVTSEPVGDGFFTCCEYCWKRMTDLEKIDSVLDLFFKWYRTNHETPFTQEEMLDALARDLKVEAEKE